MVSVTSPRTLRAFPMTGVISALPANHRLGGSLEKLSSRVDARRCLWDKLLSSMIRYRLNVTILCQLTKDIIPTLSKETCQFLRFAINSSISQFVIMTNHLKLYNELISFQDPQNKK